MKVQLPAYRRKLEKKFLVERQQTLSNLKWLLNSPKWTKTKKSHFLWNKKKCIVTKYIVFLGTAEKNRIIPLDRRKRNDLDLQNMLERIEGKSTDWSSGMILAKDVREPNFKPSCYE